MNKFYSFFVPKIFFFTIFLFLTALENVYLFTKIFILKNYKVKKKTIQFLTYSVNNRPCLINEKIEHFKNL